MYLYLRYQPQHMRYVHTGTMIGVCCTVHCDIDRVKSSVASRYFMLRHRFVDFLPKYIYKRMWKVILSAINFLLFIFTNELRCMRLCVLILLGKAHTHTHRKTLSIFLDNLYSILLCSKHMRTIYRHVLWKNR